MSNGSFPVAKPDNEPIRAYGPGSPEKKSLKQKLSSMLSETVEIPIIIGGEEVRTGNLGQVVCPHDHQHVLATYHQAGAEEVDRAARAAADAWHDWSEMPRQSRAAVLLKAADLLAGPYRDDLNAATMLNQSKTVFQAEIDAACELIDFWRFNPYYMQQLYKEQPGSAPGMWNYVEYRALEGFVFAATPFNFTSIAGNLPTAPALMGNVALWKPASTAVLSGYRMMKILEAAGLPPGVINFLPGRGGAVGNPVLARPELAGIHFTGSTSVFQGMWSKVGGDIAHYKTYPRIVGETGGKDFIFAHASADADGVAIALLRGAFEYQGQKCSAASRAYIPRSLWPQIKDRLLSELATVKMGTPMDFRNFVGAVIDRSSYDNIMHYIEAARASSDCEILAGGKGDDSVGYFVEPTVVETQDANHKLMREEIFGPVMTIFVYEDRDLDATLELCDATSPYALTGAIFATDRRVIVKMAKSLRHAAGNFYINDKPTGAVVGQQPFGGGRASGTNDKAGSMQNLLRWTSVRTMKETFVSPTEYSYPHLGEE